MILSKNEISKVTWFRNKFVIQVNYIYNRCLSYSKLNKYIFKITQK